MKPKTLPIRATRDLGALLGGVQPATADLTPLLDTVFLIILLLLATLINSSIVRGFPVNLPAFSDHADVQKDNEAMEISIDKDGRIYFAREEVSFPDMDRLLQDMTVRNPSCKAFVRADIDVPYGYVAQVLCRLSNRLPGREVILIVHKTDPQSEQNGKEAIRKEETSP